MLAFALFAWDEDGITAVDAALRDGTLNGHQHTDAEIAELERSGKKHCALPPILVGK
jgi:hypothetical protein